jgi:hypothetical protein
MYTGNDLYFLDYPDQGITLIYHKNRRKAFLIDWDIFEKYVSQKWIAFGPFDHQVQSSLST